MAFNSYILDSTPFDGVGTASTIPVVSYVPTGLPTSYIPTFAASVTVTDYVLSGLSVTFSPLPALGLKFSYAGSYTNTQGLDPVVMMRYSDDSGHSWVPERKQPIGKIGEKHKRVIFRRLGSSRNRVYEIKVSDPVKVTIYGAELEVEEGAS